MNSQVPGNWNVAGFETVTPAPEGLHIVTAKDGQLLRPMDIPHAVDAISVQFRAAAQTEAKILWHARGAEETAFFQVPFIIPAGNVPVNLNLIDYDTWDRRADSIGIALPAGADVHLQHIDFVTWNVFEKTGEIVRSFFVMDQLLPFSINFIWGPVLARTPIGRAALFTTLPPRGWSFARIVLPIIGLAGLVLFLHWLFRPDSRSRRILSLPLHLGIFLIVAATAWTIFDLRMGAEFLNYVKADFETYISNDTPQRDFRGFGNFHEDMESILPLLQQEPTFVMHWRPQNPYYYPAMRYMAYPTVPIRQESVTDGVRNWLVVEREGITLSPERQLMFEGNPLTPPGQIVKRFNDYSFLFRTDD